MFISCIKYFFITIFCATLFIFTSVFCGHADIYTYIDSDGVLHFTNVPTSSDYKFYLSENPSKASIKYSTSKYDHFISEASIRYGVSFPLLKALIKVESNFNPKAVSKAGAMDIQPKGFSVIEINGYITDKSIKQVEKVLEDEKLRKKMVDHNYEIAKACFSYSVLHKKLKNLLMQCTACDF